MEVFDIKEVLSSILGALIGMIVGYFIRKNIGEGKINNAEELAKKIIEDAKKNAESYKREAILEAKDEIHKLRTEAERENRERRNEVQRLERRVIKKEESVDRNWIPLKEGRNNCQENQAIGRKEATINSLHEQQLKELEKLSGLTSEEANHLIRWG